jgi:hypothetical protein
MGFLRVPPFILHMTFHLDPSSRSSFRDATKDSSPAVLSLPIFREKLKISKCSECLYCLIIAGLHIYIAGSSQKKYTAPDVQKHCSIFRLEVTMAVTMFRCDAAKPGKNLHSASVTGT